MKILLVDDHPLFRAGFHAMLAQRLPNLAVDSVGSLDEALQLLERDEEIALVLLDVHLQQGDGFDALRAIGRRFPTVACVMISGDEQQEVAARALACGASGFIPKSLTVDETVAAIQHVLAGNVFAPQKRAASAPADSSLTWRQIEVMNMLGRGMTNKEIARVLKLSERTVKAHISGVFEALSVRNRTEAVLAAQRRGLLSTERRDNLAS